MTKAVMDIFYKSGDIMVRTLFTDFVAWLKLPTPLPNTMWVLAVCTVYYPCVGIWWTLNTRTPLRPDIDGETKFPTND